MIKEVCNEETAQEPVYDYKEIYDHGSNVSNSSHTMKAILKNVTKRHRSTAEAMHKSTLEFTFGIVSNNKKQCGSGRGRLCLVVNHLANAKSIRTSEQTYVHSVGYSPNKTVPAKSKPANE